MELLARWEGAVLLAEEPGLDGEELPPCHFVCVLGPHFLLQHLAYHPRHAGLPLGRLDTDPPGNLFVQGNRDVSHATRLVAHEVRVNLVARLHKHCPAFPFPPHSGREPGSCSIAVLTSEFCTGART